MTNSGAVRNDATQMTVPLTPSESGAHTRIGKPGCLTTRRAGLGRIIALVDGSNACKLEVTAPGGVTQRTYDLDVTRLAAE